LLNPVLDRVGAPAMTWITGSWSDWGVTSLEHPGIRTVVTALAGAGATVAAAGVRILDADARTAAHAAAALGINVGAIANSLVFDADGAPVLVLTSGAHRADTTRLAALLEAQRIRRADPDFVRSHTGQPIGGVAPVGHPMPIRTVVDRALNSYDVVWAAAGHPKAVFPSTFDELVALTDGLPADVGAPAEAASRTAEALPHAEAASRTAEALPHAEAAFGTAVDGMTTQGGVAP
jgi:prolyl-tRNA editing enzyme YbaK/EbsC (Cys-tRNA(Pro) deacylase)